MTLYRLRREPGKARHGGEQVQCETWYSVGRRRFSQAFAPERQFAGGYKAQTQCLALEGSRLNRPHA